MSPLARHRLSCASATRVDCSGYSGWSSVDVLLMKSSAAGAMEKPHERDVKEMLSVALAFVVTSRSALALGSRQRARRAGRRLSCLFDPERRQGTRFLQGEKSRRRDHAIPWRPRDPGSIGIGRDRHQHHRTRGGRARHRQGRAGKDRRAVGPADAARLVHSGARCRRRSKAWPNSTAKRSASRKKAR